jgi:hypothetical protein
MAPKKAAAAKKEVENGIPKHGDISFDGTYLAYRA